MLPFFKSRTLPVIPCGVAIIRRGREFLIAQRKKNDSFGNYWEFPGGKKNEGETFEQCVAREIREEIGIEVRVEEKLMEIRRAYNEKMIWLNFYLCSHVSGNPEPLDCQNVEWVDVAHLREYKFPPANDRVIKKLYRQFALGKK